MTLIDTSPPLSLKNGTTLANNAELRVTEPLIKLRTIKKSENHLIKLDQIKSSWFGRLYSKNLKQIKFIRWLTVLLWRNLYPFYINVSIPLSARKSTSWLPLIKMKTYVEELDLTCTKVFEAANVKTPIPKVLPLDDEKYLLQPHDNFMFPPVYVAELGSAMIYGGTNLVHAKNKVICHDLYDFERDYTSEELHGRHVIDAKKARIRMLYRDAAPENIPVAATFLDACAPNYAHWLTEVLPRIAAFSKLEQFASVPIVINDGLHRNIIESLALIVGSDREIIALPLWRGIHVEKLYVTSTAGYVPFEKRKQTLANHSHGLFCPHAFEEMKNRLLLKVDCYQPGKWPNKVYLRRTSQGRNVSNAVEIDKFLFENGYVSIEPEKLTFSQQLALFSNVEFIVGPSGAAMANIIFTQPQTRVDIFIGKLEGTSYWYWQNIACASGNKIKYIFGRIESDGIHSDFSIDVNKIHQIFKKEVSSD